MHFTRAQTEQYLDRIGYHHYPTDLTEVTLSKIHERHVLSVPFEDIDIQIKRKITLELDSLFDKVVNQSRGGFCYELNYMFNNLLRSIGFKSHIVSSRIYTGNDDLGPDYDHMSIIVQFKDQWLVDVGYGDLFIHPIPIITELITNDWFKSYRIDRIDFYNFRLSESRNGKDFKPRYQFSTRPSQVQEFQDQCEWKQNHPASYFVNNYICTIPTERGRYTIMNDSLVRWQDGSRTEQLITSKQELQQLLKNRFGIHP